jgi:KUP system potassium uptake protein
MNTETPSAAPRPPNASLLALSALGVVFGDIGTSPLYAFENSFVGDHKLPIDSFHVMGVLSLIYCLPPGRVVELGSQVQL